MTRLWDKGVPLDQRVLRYTAGEDHRLDERLVAYDVRASIAHAEALSEAGLLGEEDCRRIRDGLRQLETLHAAGEWRIELDDEDVHTALESRLTARIGEAGARLHLGRSRNDQLLAALRLYLLDAATDIQGRLGILCEALGDLGRREQGLEIPGYTHMQQAMPSSVELWCGGFIEALEDDAAGIEAARRRLDRNPLGSAAGYGTPGLPIDREATTRKLGFAVTQAPVTAVQLSRGKAECTLLLELALVMQDLGRLAADLLLFYTEEFGFVELAPDATTGSSIMPQKRNPDVLELVRAGSATATACLDECLMITAKLPSGYQRDLQRLKPPLFRSIDLVADSIDAMAHVVSGVTFVPEKIRLAPGIHAAEEANRLVTREGIPFREAYRRVAERHHD
ncbi:MAG TPA: argininosuccinate lyase [Woeseiaceae bacterium]|nr:argininosuccinate lyase [Woeseiaceae bacterium]